MTADWRSTSDRRSTAFSTAVWPSSAGSPVRGQWRALMRLPEELAWSAVRGQTDPPLGWYSPCFGAKLPIVTLVGKGVIAGGARLTTDIRIELEASR